jgi:uncharacterized membrane protein
MGELVVLGFEDKHKADEVLLALLKLQQEHLADLEDALVVTKNTEGKIRVKPCHDLVKPGDLSNELWGGIISSVIFHRSLQLIDDPSASPFDPTFLLKVEEMLQPNSSALFIEVTQADPEKLMSLLHETGGQLLRTSYLQQKATDVVKKLS